MKKIIAILLAAMLVCLLSFGVYAEDVPVEDGEQPPAEETPDETPDEIPDETPDGETPKGDENEKPEAQIEAELTTEKIVNYIKANLEEWSVIITMILTVFYQARKHLALNKSITTMNNNTVSVAENSATAIANTVQGMAGMTETVAAYQAGMEKLMAEVRATEEEKQKLVKALADVNTHLQVSKAANIEFANELAELLVLANIPNSKKDELYARHRAAVGAISAAENTEVKDNDREEA